MTRSYVGCPDHPLFPGEPPPEAFFVGFETLALAFAAAAALCWLAAKHKRSPAKAARATSRIAAVLVLIGLPCVVPFLRRNTAEWKELQHALRAHEAALRAYQLAHPGLTNRELVEGFRAHNSQPWQLHFADPNIRPVYFKLSDWRDKVPRIVVAYNDCNNVVFDSDTMWVEVSD